MGLSHFRDRVVRIARDQGFSLVGFLNRRDANFGNWIGDWLDGGYHGEMKWMERHRAIRRAPCTIEPYSESIITMAYPYLTKKPDCWRGRNPISNYAWGEDYHKVLKRKIEHILAEIRLAEPRFEGRGFVDSAPIPEKITAAVSGLGWVGKNGMLINRHLGSYLFLAEIVCNIPFSSTPSVKPLCGRCTKCIDACPAGAIMEGAKIDCRNCISYLTIEKREAFTDSEKSKIDYQLFGCDICQQVCPWNRKQREIPNSPFRCFERWMDLDLDRIDRLTDREYEVLKRNSPIKRVKLGELKRNARAIAETGRRQGFD